MCVFEWVAANVVAKHSIGNSFEGEQVIKQFILFDKVPLLCKVAKEFVSNSLLQCTRVRLECSLWIRYGFLG